MRGVGQLFDSQSHQLPKEFWPVCLLPRQSCPITPSPERARTIRIPPDAPKGIFPNPACFWKKSNQSRPLPKESGPIPATPKIILRSPAHFQNKNLFPSPFFPKESWPIPPSPKRIWTDPTCSWQNSDQICLFPKEFRPIQPAPKKNSNRSCLFLKESGPISPVSKWIWTNPNG